MSVVRVAPRVRQLRAGDLWRGDIVLTSMRAKPGHIVENSFINLLTLSFYSHAMLVVGPGEVIEFRNKLERKPLRAALTEGGKHEISVAHVFRHKRSNGALRERLVREAMKKVDSFRPPSFGDYVMRVWLGMNDVRDSVSREQIYGMLVCSTFVAATYHDAGAPLSPDDPHNMTPGDIALCADYGLAPAAHSAQDAAAVVWTAARKLGQFPYYAQGPNLVAFTPALELLGIMHPSEHRRPGASSDR